MVTRKGKLGLGGQRWRGWVRWTRANWAPVKVHYGRRAKYQNKRYKPRMGVIQSSHETFLIMSVVNRQLFRKCFVFISFFFIMISSSVFSL